MKNISAFLHTLWPIPQTRFVYRQVGQLRTAGLLWTSRSLLKKALITPTFSNFLLTFMNTSLAL